MALDLESVETQPGIMKAGKLVKCCNSISASSLRLNAFVAQFCCDALYILFQFHPISPFAIVVMFVPCNEEVNGQGLSRFLRRLVQSVMLLCHEPKPEPVTPQSQQLQQLQQQRWQ